MNTQSRLLQRCGALGIAFSVLFAATFVLTGSQPGITSSSAKVMKYYQSHRIAELVAVLLIAIAAIVFIFFLSSLRRALTLTDKGRQLAPVVMAGGAVYVGGLLFTCVLGFALVDSAHHHMVGVLQTLNVLDSEDFVPVVVGLSIVTLATGIAALRSNALPRWLGWASIALGILAIAGPLGELAFIVTPLWTLAVGIVLFRSTEIDPSVELAAPTFSRVNS